MKACNSQNPIFWNFECCFKTALKIKYNFHYLVL